MVGFSLRTTPLLFAVSAGLMFGCGGTDNGGDGGSAGSGGTAGSGGAAGTAGSAGGGGSGGTGGTGGTGGSGGTGGTSSSGFCISNDDCAANEFCADKDECRGLGVCKSRPESCEGVEIRDVCGCDGSTYDSKCHAEMAGVTLVSEDSCVGACCQDTSDCEAGGCIDWPGGCDGPSVCAECAGSAPTCGEQPIPVCGCDGVTYECPDPPLYSVGISAVGPCTCENNADCLPTEYCHAADCTGPGNCLPRATCVSTSPAAGCDGAIYSNACEAAEAGVRVERDVVCSSDGFTYTQCREFVLSR